METKKIYRADLAPFMTDDGLVKTSHGNFKPDFTLGDYLFKCYDYFDDDVDFVYFEKLGDFDIDIVRDTTTGEYLVCQDEKDPLEPTAEDLHEYQMGWLEGALL